MTLHATILFLSLLAEAFYGLYILSVNRRRLVVAVAMTFGMNLVNGQITRFYVADPALNLTSALGEALGTAAIILWAIRQDQKEEEESELAYAALEEQVENIRQALAEYFEIEIEETEDELEPEENETTGQAPHRSVRLSPAALDPRPV